MNNLKQYLIDEAKKEIADKEHEVMESDKELQILSAKLKVENKVLDMNDLVDGLRQDFIYSIQALENLIAIERDRIFELKKELEVLKYREAVIVSKFSDNELDH